MHKGIKKLSGLMFFGALTALLPSCADESPFSVSSGENGAEGSIKINLYSSSEVSTALPGVRGTEDIVVPPSEKFGIKLTKTDGSYNKTWTTLTDFAKESSFPVGTYHLEATYGHDKSQGVVKPDEEGHEHAYYYGIEENIIVKENETTNVHLTASLLNSVVKVEYTDAFKNYFKTWSTILKPKGEESITLGDSLSTCYVIPDSVALMISVGLQNGKTVTLNPTSFLAEPKHLYKIRYNVNDGNVGNAQLSITFNDDPDQTHDIMVELTDDLFNADAPVVTASGFKFGEDVPVLAGFVHSGMLAFDIVAVGGIKSAVMTITDYSQASYLKDGEIDLCAAGADAIEAMNADGIKLSGFNEELGKFARVDFSGFGTKLKSGDYTVQLVVTDALGQSHQEEAKVRFLVEDPEMNVESLTPAIFGNGYADVVVTYNGNDPTKPGKNPFSFKIKGDNDFENVNVISIDGKGYSTRSDAFPVQTYTYRIELPYADIDEYPLEMYFNGIESSKRETTVVLSYPEYTIEYDAFAKKIRMRLEEVKGITLDNAKKELFNKRIRFGIEENGALQEVKLKAQDGSTSIFWLDKVFEPGREYSICSTLKSSKTEFTSSTACTVNIVKTEVAAAVPNGDFENLTTAYSGTMNMGGPWRTSFNLTDRQNTVSFEIKEADGWATTNLKTFNGKNSLTSSDNSWFYQPSVFNSNLSYTSTNPGSVGGTNSGTKTPDSYSYSAHGGNNAMVIRNVAYDPSGTVPSRDSGRNSFDDYYNSKVPDISKRAVGKMFLGTYAFVSGLGTITEGTPFTSRPSKLTGYYTYTPDKDSNEHGVLTVKLLDQSGKVITQGTADLTETYGKTDYQTFSIDFSFNSFMVIPSKLCIMIASSQYEDEDDIQVTTYNSNYESYQHGATLVIDDLVFEY